MKRKNITVYENEKHEWVKIGEDFLYDTLQCVHCGLEISETQLGEPLPKCVKTKNDRSN